MLAKYAGLQSSEQLELQLDKRSQLLKLIHDEREGDIKYKKALIERLDLLIKIEQRKPRR
ncbi:hypothetical protein KW797_02175 [Candidatus Parcubacteria bacterium]|nr:hypothetical protein [Candidatus Parcubacteria bacterium]